MPMTLEEALASWRDEADRYITVTGADTAVTKVLIHNQQVAAFQPFGALITREDCKTLAEKMAESLRAIYVSFAREDLSTETMGARASGSPARSCVLTACDDPYHATFEEGDVGPLELCLDHFDQIAR